METRDDDLNEDLGAGLILAEFEDHRDKEYLVCDGC